ncbi:MAG TPA: tannase/feruloyl esterase family alpha/beta hydrolase [Solimonas sp.]|nr:tannase/feruloyl esterase family alpha/beta hydrolase [Solimonas sp.]
MSTFPLRALPRLVTLALACLAANACAGHASASSACDALAHAALDGGEVTDATLVRGGWHFSMAMLAIAHRPFIDLPASCRVTLRLRPSTDSDIRAEVWLPATQWNGKLQGIGNGGLAGSIDPLQMSIAIKHGFAAVGTDTGHRGKDTDATWALGHPEKIRDFGWRAVHESTRQAKIIVDRYYGKPAQKSYFAGCSYGGRTALRLAQQFPDDYDGIIAGAPANDGSNLITTGAWLQQRIRDVPGAWIPQKKQAAIAARVLAMCDGDDGVKDGVLDDPRTCGFQPEDMQCKGVDTDTCLTPPQVETLRRIYDGPGGNLGDSIAHGYERGGEGSEHWRQWQMGDKPGNSVLAIFGREFFRNFVYDDPHWDLDRADYAKDRIAARERLGPDYDARDPDLSAFRARGGKLIMFHGWNDAALSPRLSVDYYENVRRTLGAAETDDFMRLYMVPGMEHCVGGPGTNAVGWLPLPGNAPDANGGIGAALEAWVERGEAPQSIVAAKYEDDMRGMLAPATTTLIRTRPLCPYPQVARWNGEGSTDEARNFSCVNP